jgi:hypothetical protein
MSIMTWVGGTEVDSRAGSRTWRRRSCAAALLCDWPCSSRHSTSPTPPVPAIIFVSDDNTLSRNAIVCQDRLGTKTRMIGHRRRFFTLFRSLTGPVAISSCRLNLRKTRLCFEFSLCLSRACLGKMIVFRFLIAMAQKTRFPYHSVWF